MWIQRCQIDAHLEAPLPIPTQVKDELVDTYGYPPLADRVKAKVFGLNAARLFEVAVSGVRKAGKVDKLANLKKNDQSQTHSSKTQDGWVWLPEPGKKPAPPIGS